MKLTAAMKAVGISRKELAEFLNVSEQMVWAVETGRRMFSPKKTVKLLALFKGKVTYEELVGGKPGRGKAA